MKWIGTQVIYNDLRLKRKLFLEAPEAGGSGIDKFLCLNDVGNVRYRTGTQLLSDIGGGATNSVSLLPDDVNSYASGGNADGTANATAAIIQVKGGEGINTTANDQIGFSGGAFPAITITGEDASTTNKGIVELATTAETTTGTATGLAVTPDGLKDGYQGSTNITTLGAVSEQKSVVFDGDRTVTSSDGSVIHIDAFDVTDNNSEASGTLDLYTHVNIENPRLLATNVNVTTTNAATLYITGPPNAGTNQTITNPYALWIDAGNVRLDGEIYMGTTRAMDSNGLLRVADQSTITGLGTITSGTWKGTAIATAYIADDAITENKLDNTLLAEIDANTAKATNVATNLTATTHASQITINSSDGTNVVVAEASGSIAGVMTVAHHDKLDGIETSATADQTRSDIEGLGITVVGTIGEGTWQGTAIASAYLDADTAHYSATRQATHHIITDDIDSDVIYISLLDSDAETSSATNKQLPFIAPTAGKLLKIFLRTSVDYSSETFTWKLYTRNVSSGTGGAPSEIGAQSGAGPTNKTMVTYDFTSSLDSGTNAIVAGDKVQISIEAGDGATANGNYFITCLWEWDLS